LTTELKRYYVVDGKKWNVWGKKSESGEFHKRMFPEWACEVWGEGGILKNLLLGKGERLILSGGE